MNHVQKQVYKQIDAQVQQEIDFYVFQDLANVLGVLADTIESVKYLHHDHPYVPIAMNRLTLQMNLSNGILFDQQLTHERNKDHDDNFRKAKQEAKAIFQETIKNMNIENSDSHIEKCIKYYEDTTLNADTKMIPLLPPANLPKQKGEFNQEVVQTLFNSMSQVDNTISEIAQKKYKRLSVEEIQEQTRQRALRAQSLLSHNFPKPKSGIDEEVVIQAEDTAIHVEEKKEDLCKMETEMPQQGEQYNKVEFPQFNEQPMPLDCEATEKPQSQQQQQPTQQPQPIDSHNLEQQDAEPQQNQQPKQENANLLDIK